MRTCFYYSPKKLDKYGRRIVIERLDTSYSQLLFLWPLFSGIGFLILSIFSQIYWIPFSNFSSNLDVDVVKKKYGMDNVYRTIVLICDWLNRDENVQVNGGLVLIDFTNVTMRHQLKLMSFEDGKKIMQFYQKSLPVRMKGFHMYNEPPFYDALWALYRPLLTEKTQNRTVLHGKNMAKVYDYFDMSVLPQEYLPDDYTGPNAGTEKHIVEEMIEDMMKPEFRNYIKDLSSSKYGVDLEKKKQSLPTVASFRKLNV